MLLQEQTPVPKAASRSPQAWGNLLSLALTGPLTKLIHPGLTVTAEEETEELSPGSECLFLNEISSC